MDLSILINKLEMASKELNQVSDELGLVVDKINAGLKELNLGLVVWLTHSESSPVNSVKHVDGWERQFGYARVKSKWGLSIQYTQWKDGKREVELWSFNDAPRWMRVEMIGMLPELLDEMVVRAKEMCGKLENSRVKVEVMLQGIEAAKDK